jgi:hypothetical protein
MSFDLIRTAWAAGAPATLPKDPFGGKYDALSKIFYTITNIVFYVGIALVLIFLIVGGIRYITSGGDKAGTEAARGMITSAVIGFIVVLGAFALKMIIENILGANIPAANWF